MGEGRAHQKYEDAPLFRAIITTTQEPRGDKGRSILEKEGGTLIEIKGPFNAPGPARAAVTRAEGYEERWPTPGRTVTGRVQVGVVNWGDLT